MRLQLFILRLSKFKSVVQSPRLLRAFLKYRVLAGVEHKPVLSAGLSTVVDIGANRGQFSLAVRHLAPKARIFAFEPLAAPAAVFRKVFAKDSLFTLHQAAVGAEQGEAIIHVTEDDDSSSLLPIGPLQRRLFPRMDEVRTETVRVSRLAEFFSAEAIIPPALLKLDVQGYELEALKGCDDLLERFQYVYAECSFMELYTGQALAHEIIAWLNERRFRLSGVYNMHYDRQGRAVQGDFLFQASGIMAG